MIRFVANMFWHHLALGVHQDCRSNLPGPIPEPAWCLETLVIFSVNRPSGQSQLRRDGQQHRSLALYRFSEKQTAVDSARSTNWESLVFQMLMLL